MASLNDVVSDVFPLNFSWNNARRPCNFARKLSVDYVWSFGVRMHKFVTVGAACCAASVERRIALAAAEELSLICDLLMLCTPFSLSFGVRLCHSH
jgi:hypothetical protein